MSKSESSDGDRTFPPGPLHRKEDTDATEGLGLRACDDDIGRDGGPMSLLKAMQNSGFAISSAVNL